jgi:hypothetical protein
VDERITVIKDVREQEGRRDKKKKERKTVKNQM